MWPVSILLIIMKKYTFIASEKKKSPQLVEALEMLKKIYFEQEYVSRIHNQESEFKKKWDFIPRLLQLHTFVISTFYNTLTVKSLELLGKHNTCKCEFLLKMK